MKKQKDEYFLNSDTWKSVNHYSALAELVFAMAFVTTLQFSKETITQDEGFYALAVLIPLYLLMCGSKIARTEQKEKEYDSVSIGMVPSQTKWDRAAQLWNVVKFGMAATGTIFAILGFEALRLDPNDALGDEHLKLGFGLIIAAGLLSTVYAAYKATKYGLKYDDSNSNDNALEKINHNRAKAAVGFVIVAAFTCLTFGDMFADTTEPLNFSYGETAHWHLAGWGLLMFGGGLPIMSEFMKKKPQM